MRRYFVKINDKSESITYDWFVEDEPLATGLNYVEICSRMAKALSELEDIGFISHYQTLDLYDDPVAFNEFMENILRGGVIED